MTKSLMARRIALLSSSSLGLAAIVSAASVAAPGAALAQTVTCTATPTPVSTPAPTGNGTSAVTISGGSGVIYNPGIICNYTGDGATVTTTGAFTVSNSGGVPANPLINGVNLRATGMDDIAWTSIAGTVTGSTQTNGPVIDALSEDGVITINTAGVTGTSATVTHGIYAESDTGTINITATGTVSATNSTSGRYGIEAVTGGAIDITTASVSGRLASVRAQSTGGAVAITTNGSVSAGIIAQTSGAGAVTLDLNSSVAGTAAGPAIRVTNGAGPVSIDAVNSIQSAAGGMVIDSDGDIVVDSTSWIRGGTVATGPRAAAITASGQTFILTMTGDPNSPTDHVLGYRASLGGALNVTSFPVSGGTVSGPTGYSGGHVDLSGVTDGATLNFESHSRWVVTDTSLLSPVGDVVSFDETSALITSHYNEAGDGSPSPIDTDFDQTLVPPGVIDFGDGDDVLNSQGRIVISPTFGRDTLPASFLDGPPPSHMRYGTRGELRLLDLEQFNNSGEIWLGARFYRDSSIGVLLTGADRWHDDLLYMPGTTFHGEEGSVVIMDVDLNKTQSSCAPSTRDASGWLPAADCIGIPGGAATGRTELRIVELIPGDRGAYNPDGIVLVDLAGSDPDDTDPLAFVISPQTERYLDLGDNGAIEKGVFAYALGFDADDQQFKLYGVPSSGAQQFPILATAANQLWQTATGGWFDRRVHQRDTDRDAGLGAGAWFSVSGVGAQRDITTVVELGAGSGEFDNSYEQSDVTISFGWDLLDYGSNAALGAMVGYAHSEVEFDGSDNSANLEGVHAGLYGGYAVGGFFVDAAVNAAMLSLYNDVPAMALEPAGTVLDTEVWSLGARIEAGWRWDAGYGLWVEPLVGFSAVGTDFEDMRVPNGDPDATRPGVSVRLDGADSRRASAGLRLGMQDLWADVAPTSFSLTARAVNEFEGGANVSIENIGPTLLSTDSLDGAFTQLTGSVGVSNAAKTISGYFNVESVTGDDYESLGASVGMRLYW